MANIINQLVKFCFGSQSAYDALATIENNKIYFLDNGTIMLNGINYSREELFVFKELSKVTGSSEYNPTEVAYNINLLNRLRTIYPAAANEKQFFPEVYILSSIEVIQSPFTASRERDLVVNAPRELLPAKIALSSSGTIEGVYTDCFTPTDGGAQGGYQRLIISGTTTSNYYQAVEPLAYNRFQLEQTPLSIDDAYKSGTILTAGGMFWLLEQIGLIVDPESIDPDSPVLLPATETTLGVVKVPTTGSLLVQDGAISVNIDGTTIKRDANNRLYADITVPDVPIATNTKKGIVALATDSTATNINGLNITNGIIKVVAGNGLAFSSGALVAKAGNGITVDSNGIHAKVAAPIMLTGSNYGKSITLDYNTDELELDSNNKLAIKDTYIDGLITTGVTPISERIDALDLNKFKTVTAGSTAITAASPTDNLNLAAGNGIEVTGNASTKTATVAAKKDPSSEAFLTIGANGIKVSGIQTAINTAISNLGTALVFVGTSTTDPKGTSGATVSGHTTWKKGEVVLYNNKEYVLTGNSNVAANWTELGDESSYALKTVEVKAGSGLTGGGQLTGDVTLSHDDTSSQASVSAQSGKYISGITLDTFGHVTGISTASEQTIPITGANRGLSVVSNKVGHSNTSITALTTQSLRKIAYDTYGHITGSAAVAKTDITNLGIPDNDSMNTAIAAAKLVWESI